MPPDRLLPNAPEQISMVDNGRGPGACDAQPAVDIRPCQEAVGGPPAGDRRAARSAEWILFTTLD
jgi:hypothetical protein